MAAFWFGLLIGSVGGLVAGVCITVYVIKRKKLPPTEGGG